MPGRETERSALGPRRAGGRPIASPEATACSTASNPSDAARCQPRGASNAVRVVVLVVLRSSATVNEAGRIRCASPRRNALTALCGATAGGPVCVPLSTTASLCKPGAGQPSGGGTQANFSRTPKSGDSTAGSKHRASDQPSATPTQPNRASFLFVFFLFVFFFSITTLVSPVSVATQAPSLHP